MKSKIFLLVGLFCFYFSFSKIVTKADEQADSVLYNATFSVEYQEGIYYNPVMRQDYEIVDSNGTILQSGVTDDNGEIDFTYSTSNSLYINSLEIKLIIYASNYAGRVIVNNEVPKYTEEHTLFSDEANEVNVQILGNYITIQESVYRAIRVSQFAVYSSFLLEDNNLDFIPRIDIQIPYSDQISCYNNNMIFFTNHDLGVFAHEYGHYVSDYLDLIKMNSALDHSAVTIFIEVESKKEYIEIAICEGFADFYFRGKAQEFYRKAQSLRQDPHL